MTDKIPVKNFNDFLENNDQTSAAFSKLVERTKRELKKEMAFRQYRYNKKELMEISKYPLSKITRSEFYDRLKKSNLSDDLIFSLERKANWSDNDSRTRNNKSRYGQDFEAGDREDHRNNFRFETDNGSNWRNYRGRPNQQDSRFRKNDRYPYNRNRNGMRDDEPLPEWFSNGAESMTDFIDLKGFDDDDLSEPDEGNKKKNLSTQAQFGDSSFLDDSSLNIFESTAIDGFNRNTLSNASSLHDSKSSLFASDIFLENKDMEQFPPPLFNSSMNSSRANKWFKSRQEDSGREDIHPNGLEPKGTLSNKSQLMDLLNKKNIDLSKLPQPPKNMELSNAVNVSDLEASMLNSSSDNHKKPDVMPSEAEIMSRLMSLSRPDSKSSTHSSNGMKPIPEDMARMPPIPMPNMPMINPMFRYPPMQPHPMPGFPSEQFYPQPRPMPPPPMMYPPPEMANAPFPFNPFCMPPNFPIPPQMLMNNPNMMNPNMIPHRPDHPPFNPAPEVKARNDDSIANKLLKNTQFTPTSVYRKLKEHEQSKTKVMKPSDMFEAVASAREVKDSTTISEVDNFLKQLKLGKLSGTSAPAQHEPQSPASPSGRTNAKTLNPNDIFNVLKRNDNNVSRLDLPPLPLQNALTVDDIENF